MKKSILITFVILLLASSTVLADDSENTQGFEVAQTHVAYQVAKIQLGMSTTIDYIQSLGGDTLSLELIKSDFDTLSANIGTYTSLEELRAGNEDMRGKVKEFREEARTLIEENGGDIETLRGLIHDALEADTDLQDLKTRFSETAQSYLLDRFDRHYERLQGIYDRVYIRYGESNPDEVANLQSILNSISAQRETLSSAAASGDLDTIKETFSSVHDLYQEFIQAVKDLTAGTGEGSPIGEHRGQGKSEDLNESEESSDDEEEETNETDDSSDDEEEDMNESEESSNDEEEEENSSSNARNSAPRRGGY